MLVGSACCWMECGDMLIRFLARPLNLPESCKSVEKRVPVMSLNCAFTWSLPCLPLCLSDLFSVCILGYV